MASQSELLGEFKTYMAVAIHQNLSGEHVYHESSMIVLPTNQGLSPAIAVFMAIRGLVLGEMAQTFSVLPLLGHTQESVTQFVNDAIESMLSARSEEASKALAGEAGPSGKTSGLVLP